MGKALTRLKAVLTAHPRWATQLTPANVIAVSLSWGIIAFMSPRSALAAQLAIYIMLAILAWLLIVTARDIALHRWAITVADRPEELEHIQRSYDFLAWVQTKAKDSQVELTWAHKNIVGATFKERYALAKSYEHYTLVAIFGKWRVLQILGGALQLIVMLVYFLMPTKLARLRKDLHHRR